MNEKYFHDAKSWPLCCISPAPATVAIALLHCKWLKKTHEVLNFLNSRNLKSQSHIFKFLYITQLSYKPMFHNQRASAINFQYYRPSQEIGHPIHFLRCHCAIAIKSKLCHALRNCCGCSAWPSSDCLCSYQSCKFFEYFYPLLASIRAALPCPVISP